MTKRAILSAALVAASVVGFFTFFTISFFSSATNGFLPYPLPLETSQDLMDIGVADINGDGWLDIFTTNHNYRQNLLIADGRGGYKDSLSALGFDQSPNFPGLEICLTDPGLSDPGVYVYWKERKKLIIRSHNASQFGRLRGTLRTYTTVKRSQDAGLRVEISKSPPPSEGEMPETLVTFESEGDRLLELEIASPGIPVKLHFDASIPEKRIFVGCQRISPRSNDFELAFQDPHGMAWADYNNDGSLDAFVTRGAVGGTLGLYPQSVSSKIKDQFLVSQAGGRYRNVVTEVGIEKHDCSGRQAKWVDFNRDGLLDLYINCQNRGFVKGNYPKQLYRQDKKGKFVDVAAQVGLALPDHEIIDLVWLDVDNDGYMDLVTSESTGFFVYWNESGKRFVPQFLGRGRFVRADNPKLGGITDEYWFVDGKLSVADFNLDGNLDVFSSSKEGNALLINKGGRLGFSIVDPRTLGLPGESASAVWVDYDNDGLPDLHAVPQGLFRQQRDHTFESAGLLVLPTRKYMAAIINWPDFDNDGARDVMIALLENFSLWPWWKKLFKGGEDRFTWQLLAYRNASKGNHWLQVRLVGKARNRQAIGARISVRTPDGQQTQDVGNNEGAFFSQGHYRLYFGLGPRTRADSITVRWPDGQLRELKDVEGDGLLVIQEDATEQGAWAAAAANHTSREITVPSPPR